MIEKLICVVIFLQFASAAICCYFVKNCECGEQGPRGYTGSPGTQGMMGKPGQCACIQNDDKDEGE